MLRTTWCIIKSEKQDQIKECISETVQSLYNKPTVKPVLSNHSKRRQKLEFKTDYSAILSTFIKLPFSIKTFVVSIFKWPLKTGFTVVLTQNRT